MSAILPIDFFQFISSIHLFEIVSLGHFSCSLRLANPNSPAVEMSAGQWVRICSGQAFITSFARLSDFSKED